MDKQRFNDNNRQNHFPEDQGRVLSVDELVASLSRQISGSSDEEPDIPAESEVSRQPDTMEELSRIAPEPEKEDTDVFMDADALAQALVQAMDEAEGKEADLQETASETISDELNEMAENPMEPASEMVPDEPDEEVGQPQEAEDENAFDEPDERTESEEALGETDEEAEPMAETESEEAFDEADEEAEPMTEAESEEAFDEADEEAEPMAEAESEETFDEADEEAEPVAEAEAGEAFSGSDDHENTDPSEAQGQISPLVVPSSYKETSLDEKGQEESASETAELDPRQAKKAEKERLKREKEEQKRRDAEARDRHRMAEAETKQRQKQELKEQKRAEKEARKNEKKARKKGIGKIILLAIVLLIIAAAIVYAALSSRYKDVFYDGTIINGIDCTGLTVDEAETILNHQMEDYKLTINFRGDAKEEISGDSFAFEYIPDGSVQDIKDSQIPIFWATAYFTDYTYSATNSLKFDENLLTSELLKLPECQAENMTAPTNAYINYDEGSNSFVIVPETQGNTLDMDAFAKGVNETVKKGERELNVEDLGVYQTPEVVSTDENLNQQMADMNNLVTASITYELPNGEEQVLNGSTLSTWLSRDGDGNYYQDPEVWGQSLANYVEKLAEKVNTFGEEQEFVTHTGDSVMLTNNLFGWQIDLEGEGAQLQQELSDHAVTTREPVYSQRAYASDNNGIGRTYVEVDLTAQHLYAYDNGTLYLDCDIVSGKMTEDRYTPAGIYQLVGKQEGRWLRGDLLADGSYSYESWVDYWMPFNGGIGLHDASWRTEFGGSIYVGGGSHGCVNMPSSKAAELFSWITSGTPVITYYTSGYTLAAASGSED